MAVTPTNFHEVDPDDEFELIPPGGINAAATECCKCVEEDASFCGAESDVGTAVSFVGAQFVAFWYV